MPASVTLLPGFPLPPKIPVTIVFEVLLEDAGEDPGMLMSQGVALQGPALREGSKEGEGGGGGGEKSRADLSIWKAALLGRGLRAENRRPKKSFHIW